MPSESVDHQNQHLAPPPQTAESLPCPRCDSVHTKFCYYNNYNLSQPRHFCKSCRRYWTQGGTLRDVPVGGGSRKSSQRHRSSASAAATSSSSSSSSPSPSPSSVLIPHPTKSEPVPTGSASDEPNSSLNPNLSAHGHECVTSDNGIGFTSLLNSHHSPGGGFLALGGFGLEEISGFGYGVSNNNNNKAVWPFHHEVSDFGVGVNGNNTWQMAIGGGTGGSEGGLVDGTSSVDCFVWPDLSISMPGGNGLK